VNFCHDGPQFDDRCSFGMLLFQNGLEYYILISARESALITARRYAKRGICRRRVSVCLSVCVCVCLSHSGIVSKRLNVGSRKQRRTIAP